MAKNTSEWRPSFLKPNLGKAWVFGDDVTTDDIISGKYIEIRDFKEQSKYVFSDLEISFARLVKRGDLILAGENFGSGSSREQAPYLLKFVGIGIICALSFARIFFRNAMNLGLPLFTIGNDVLESFSTGDQVSYLLDPPVLMCVDDGKTFKLKSFPLFFKEMIRQGGAIPLLREKLDHEK